MGISVAKMQITLVGNGDRVVVSTRTTRYMLSRGLRGGLGLITSSPLKRSGEVTSVGSMDTSSGEVDEGSLETGKYMVFQFLGDGDWAIKTSLITRIELERSSNLKGMGSL